MKRSRPLRFSVVEYRRSPGFVGKISAATGLPGAQVAGHLAKTSSRLNRDLRLGRSPFVLEGNSLTVEDVAGLVRCAPEFELEVIPKFLDGSLPTWREDFFFLASLTRFGRIIPSSQVLAGRASRADVPALIASAMIGMFEGIERRPLRAYRSRLVTDYSADGSVDEETLVLPRADGFSQSQYVLDRSNKFSAVIGAAIQRLLPDIRDSQLHRRLSRAGRTLPKPEGRLRVSRLPRSVPSRHRRWQPLYELARYVLEGYGVSYEPQGLYGPAFVLKTPKAWEDVVLKALKLGSTQALVRAQPTFTLGHKGQGQKVKVNPDGSFHAAGCDKILVDAKYKGRSGLVTKAVARADLYEALAFAKAAKVQRVVLAYPGADEASNLKPGELVRIDSYNLDSIEVEAVQVVCRGIGSRGGFFAFSKRFATSVRALAPSVLPNSKSAGSAA